MSVDLLQFLFSGVTVGAIYALVALGFTIIYNASHVINFAQGEFVMIGGMATVFLSAGGLPLAMAVPLAILAGALVGVAVERVGVGLARDADVVGLIIITIGASILIRGFAGIVFDRNFHSLPPISDSAPLSVGGATLQPQSLWIIGIMLAVALALWAFFDRTLWGKAMIATADNPLAARLVGIDTRKVVQASFALAGGLGALAGWLITPVAATHYQVGIGLGLKGFAAAIVGGLGSGPGAIVGGLVIGLTEALSAGYLSSAYKDVMAFSLILVCLVVRPNGLLGRAAVGRV